jgi:hypothetical protein
MSDEASNEHRAGAGAGLESLVLNVGVLSAVLNVGVLSATVNSSMLRSGQMFGALGPAVCRCVEFG